MSPVHRSPSAVLSKYQPANRHPAAPVVGEREGAALRVVERLVPRFEVEGAIDSGADFIDFVQVALTREGFLGDQATPAPPRRGRRRR